MSIAFTVVLALLLGCVLGLLWRLSWLSRLSRSADRKRLDLLAEQLEAEQRIAALTRATLLAMRQAAYQSRQP